jgi:hypothetical protein
MNDLGNLYNHYQLRIVDRRRRAPVMRFPISYQVDMTAVEEMHMERYHSEPLYTLEITETNLNRLNTDVKHFQEYCRDPGAYRDMQQREDWTRRNVPAVKKAWDNYKMLLRLAAEGRTLD